MRCERKRCGVPCDNEATSRVRWLAQDQSVREEMVTCDECAGQLAWAYQEDIADGSLLIDDIEEGE